MDTKDVKVGMKVVPHDHTGGGLSWAEFLECPTGIHFLEDGFLTVRKYSYYGNSDDTDLGRDGEVNHCSGFCASDFTPAEIEVGDTVRVIDRWKYMGNYMIGAEGPVLSRTCDGRFRLNLPNHANLGFPASCLELIRKARKPEQKKEEPQMFKVGDKVKDTGRGYGEGVVEKTGIAATDYPVAVEFDKNGITRYYTADGRYTTDSPITLKHKEEPPMSKRPRLEDINERTLVKLRDGTIAIAMDNGYGQLCPYSKDMKAVGCFTISGCFEQIVAHKSYKSVPYALKAMMFGPEPAWDWRESDDKPSFKEGDWVEVVERCSGHTVGTVGQIVFIGGKEMPYKVRGNWHGTIVELWQSASSIKPCSPPAPVEITASDIKAKFGDRVIVKLDGQSIEVK